MNHSRSLIYAPRIVAFRRFLAVWALLALTFYAPHAFAACSTPAGNAGDVAYSSTQNIMVYCNGTSWVNMGTTSSIGFGILTSGDFCTATSGTNITCNTAAINLASQVTGTLLAAQFPALTGDVTNSAGSLATTVGSIGGQTISLGSSFATSGAYPLTLTTTASTSVTLPTSGTLFSTTSTNIGTANLSATGGTGSATQFLADNNTWQTLSISTGSLTGTVQVSQGGTGDTTLTANGLLLGNGTGNVASVGVGSTGTVLVGNTGAAPTFSASPSLTSLTLSGVETLTFGTNYSTVGTAQVDVAINTASSVRYTGAGASTFNGIVAGTNGQILYLHNASTYALTLANLNASPEATAANEIVTGTGSNLTVAANSAVTLQYDATATNSSGATGAWRVVGGSGGGIPAGTTGQVQFNSGSNTFAAGSNLSWSTTSNELTVGTGAATPVGLGTSGSVATSVVNVIPQAISVTYAGASGATINTAATGQMAYYSAANTISGTGNLYVAGTGIGIGTSGNVNSIPLTFSGAANQTIGMERGVSIGSSLTVKAGAGLAGGGNENGGNLILSSGVSTGTGSSNIQFNTYAAAGTSGTSDNSATTAVTILGSGNVGIGLTNPTNALQVGSPLIAGSGWEIKADNSTANGYGLNVTVNETTGGYGFLLDNYANGTTTQAFLIRNNNTASTVISALWNGSVGIGSAIPLAGLDVETTGPAWQALNRTYGYLTTGGAAGGGGPYTPTVTLGIYSPNRVLFGEVDSISDRRKKKDIADISAQAAADFIAKARPVQFHWKDHPDAKESFGFIAQDISKIGFDNLIGLSPNPKLHKTVDPDGFVSPEGAMLDLNYEGIIPLLTKAVQDMKVENGSLRAANDNQQAEIKALSARLDALEAEHK